MVELRTTSMNSADVGTGAMPLRVAIVEAMMGDGRRYESGGRD